VTSIIAQRSRGRSSPFVFSACELPDYGSKLGPRR